MQRAEPETSGRHHTHIRSVFNASICRTGIAVALFFSLFPGISARADFPNPPFPVGNFVAFPMQTQTGIHAHLTWTIHVPASDIPGNYVHYIRQTLLPNGPAFDVAVGSGGMIQAPLSLGPGGSKFELLTVRQSPHASHVLDATVAAPYVPRGEVVIRSQDPYSVLTRTRADELFHVDITAQGIDGEGGYPSISTGMTLIRHVQSYGATGTGADLDRSQATLLSTTPITADGTHTFTYAVTSIPGADPAKLRGEERFSLFSLPDAYLPQSQIDSRSIQIWPVAGSEILGIEQGQMVGSTVPEITFVLEDLYPDSITWAEVYPGAPQSGGMRTAIPGTRVVVKDSVPRNHILKTSDYGPLLNSNGLWTLEILTQTPFGIDRLSNVSFIVQTAGTPHEIWRLTHFGDVANTGDGADFNDFDKDGFPNLIEYAFGLDPKHNSAGQLPAWQKSGNAAVIGFTRPDGVSGITYGVEWSTTLLADSWKAVANESVPPQHSFTVPMGPDPQLYLRLKITSP